MDAHLLLSLLFKTHKKLFSQKWEGKKTANVVAPKGHIAAILCVLAETISWTN